MIVREPEKPVAAIIIMGVTGCGKTVIGERLAAELGCRFLEGDALHPPENIARMASGLPLTDADRQGWLDAIGAAIVAAGAFGETVVATCSALKRSYRDRLRMLCGSLFFIHLKIDRENARRRVANRTNHFMPASLVDSQFADLQPPDPDELAVTLDAGRPIDEVVDQALGFVRRSVQRATAVANAANRKNS